MVKFKQKHLGNLLSREFQPIDSCNWLFQRCYRRIKIGCNVIPSTIHVTSTGTMLMPSRTRLGLPVFKVMKNIILIAITMAGRFGSRAYKLLINKHVDMPKLLSNEKQLIHPQIRLNFDFIGTPSHYTNS